MNIEELLRQARLLSEKGEDGQCKALALLRLAHAEGSAEATYALGTWYTFGVSVEKNFSTGADYFEEAAANGYAPAQFDLAYCFESGQGREKNLQTAMKYYKLAARNGDACAAYEMGRILEADGSEPLEKNDVAWVWYVMSAENGYDEAQYLLARFYELSEGEEADQEKCLFWYRLSAAQGHEASLSALNELEADPL